MRPILRTIFTALISAIFCMPAQAWELAGSAAVEGRYFFEENTFPGQRDGSVSLVAEPELYHTWDNRRQHFTVIPFARYDSADPRRTHADIRELYWIAAREQWEISVGVRRIFWGVTESRHLVNVLNQVDLVENIDEEDYLGQPMLSLAFADADLGNLSLYWLPYFRERTFPGRSGRLRFGLPVDTDNPVYSSPAEEWHQDWAARYAHYFGALDLGLSYFQGTAREPRFLVALDGLGSPALRPLYEQIRQWGLDAQWTQGGWLWKLEAITRDGQDGRFWASVAGFEYTRVGVFGSVVDVGWLAEYLFDDRGDSASTAYQNDLFLAARIVLNDVQSTEVLAGGIIDLEGHGTFLNLEASRRIGDRIKASLEARFMVDVPADAPFGDLRNDGHILFELRYYF